MPVQRMGDVNTEGGVIMMGVPNVLVEGMPIATAFKPVASHGYGHYGALTTATQGSVICNGLPVTRMGDPDTCGDLRIGGAFTVLLGG